MKTELEKKQAELIKILDRYYVAKTRPSLDELIESEKLKAEIAELEQEPAGQVIEKETLLNLFKDFFVFHNDANRGYSGIDKLFNEWYESKQGPSGQVEGDMAEHIEAIFKNTQRIHGKSLLDWIKIASIHSERYIQTHSFESKQDKEQPTDGDYDVHVKPPQGKTKKYKCTPEQEHGTKLHPADLEQIEKPDLNNIVFGLQKMEYLIKQFLKTKT